MKKVVKKQSRAIPILLTIAAVIFVIFVLLPVTFALFDGDKMGNVAIIPIEGIITANGASYLGGNTISSQDIVSFIEDADAKSQIKIIVLEINSPGGSPVASDEIAVAIKRTEKPVIALIREVGASGGYWIASATDHIIANRMSITGSIGVISSYLEFSGLMEEYGVGYEQLTAGQFKDMGTPFKKLQDEERK
ncbi:S49 family peptidase, partial [Candidatus Woesearchaeota archaeon]|nr:S49 family peptidase [Candidatus Woesearchaeota archaeon]